MLKSPDQGGNYTFVASLVFAGPPGSGKSRLLKTIYRWYEEVGVHIKAKNVSPGFDCMVRSLEDESMRCSRDKNMTQGYADSSLTRKNSEELDVVFERVGGAYKMEMPTSWFASYVWPTFNERHSVGKRPQASDSNDDSERRKKKRFNEGTLIVYMSENDEYDDGGGVDTNNVMAVNDGVDIALQMLDSRQHCRHLAVVHLISLEKIEFNSSLSYFARSVNTVPQPSKTNSRHSSRNYRCVTYTKADAYRGGGTLPSMESIISDARTSSKTGLISDGGGGGVNVVDILEKSKFFKFVSCADDVSPYDHSFGSLRFFFDLMGKLLQLDISGHYTDQRLKNHSNNTTTDHPTTTHDTKVYRNVREIKDEGCCYQ